jgi:hypothetical protein
MSIHRAANGRSGSDASFRSASNLDSLEEHMMRILGTLKADAASGAGTPPSMELMRKMGKFVEEISKAGVLPATDGLQPRSKGRRMRLAKGKTTAIAGPLTQSKELIASCALLQMPFMDEAIHWTTRFLEVPGEGERELRPIAE